MTVRQLVHLRLQREHATGSELPTTRSHSALFENMTSVLTIVNTAIRLPMMSVQRAHSTW